MEIGGFDTTKNSLRISVDWLSFTVKSFTDWKNLASHFGLAISHFQDDLIGSYGYRKRARHMLYDISFLYDGNDDMGIHVDVSGSAVGYFLQCYLDKNTCSKTPFGSVAYEVNSFDDTILGDVLKEVLDMGQLSRLDLAVDDVGCNYYTLSELCEIFHSGLYTSRFRKYKEVYEASKIKCTGSTIYLGSTKSEMLIRIYDKQLEQNSKKNDSIQTPWTRWEIQLRKERATSVASFLAVGQSLPNVAIGILSNYLRLIVKDNVRDSRCSTAPKWLDFLAGIQKIRICQPIPEKNIDDKKEWLMKQVAPTLSAIYELDGDLSFIYSLIENGSLRWSAELEKIVHASQYVETL